MITTTTPSVEGRRITAYHGIGLGHGRDGGLTAMQALRLYWWKERVNFGDRLSRRGPALRGSPRRLGATGRGGDF